MSNKLPTSRELNDALNLVLRFACDNIPEWWEIRITATSDEAGMELYDPDGDCVSAQWDTDCRTLRGLVNEAREKSELKPV